MCSDINQISQDPALIDAVEWLPKVCFFALHSSDGHHDPTLSRKCTRVNIE